MDRTGGEWSGTAFLPCLHNGRDWNGGDRTGKEWLFFHAYIRDRIGRDRIGAEGTGRAFYVYTLKRNRGDD